MEPIGSPSLDIDEYEEELDGYEAAVEAAADHNEDFDEPAPEDLDDEP